MSFGKNLIGLKVVPERNGQCLYLDDKKIHHVEDYEIKCGLTPGTAVLTVKLLVRYPLADEVLDGNLLSEFD